AHRHTSREQGLFSRRSFGAAEFTARALADCRVVSSARLEILISHPKTDVPLSQRHSLYLETSRSKAASPLSSSHQDPNTEKKKLAQRIQEKLKPSVERMFKDTCEGVAKPGKHPPLNSSFTEGDCEGVNNEHEVRQIETASRKQSTEDTPIKSNDMFKPSPGEETPIRTVLTKGIAGIGKTITVQKFVLDWVEGIANQDVDLMFVLPFWELNLIHDEQYSLLGLLQKFCPKTEEIENINFDIYKVLLIFDGLDESRLPLDFQHNKILSDVKEMSSVDVLLTNLIQGNLLPFALLWITSRPAAANRIPPQYFHRLTEVHGFNDPQKEQYFKKRFRDPDLASTVISHIKASRSLNMMCHIPLFCWISATVLEKVLDRPDIGEIPKTVTEMYTLFLLIRYTNKRKKEDDGNEKKLDKS
ncbi:hypothetical protein AAFF_G00136230, partial [Aldrovandia affinis]